MVDGSTITAVDATPLVAVSNDVTLEVPNLDARVSRLVLYASSGDWYWGLAPVLAFGVRQRSRDSNPEPCG